MTAGLGFSNTKPDPESIYLRDKYHITSGLVIVDRAIDVEAGHAAGLMRGCFVLKTEAIEHVEKGGKNSRRY